MDAFQGRERDIIIFSCVRAAEEGGVGFLSDIRRMNVGLTRAKCSLFILGNSNFLVRNHMWRRLVEDAKARNVFTDNVRGLFDRSTRTSRKPQQALPAPTYPPQQQQQQQQWPVETVGDPMDIDDESYNANPHQSNNPMDSRMPPAGPRQNQGPRQQQQHAQSDPRRQQNQPQHVQSDPRRPQNQQQAYDPRQPQAQNQQRRPRVPNQAQQDKTAIMVCHNCNMKGHMRSSCPMEQNRRDPQIPVLQEEYSVPLPMKRPADYDNGSGSRDLSEPPNKRIHGAGGRAPMSGGSTIGATGSSGVGFRLESLVEVDSDLKQPQQQQQQQQQGSTPGPQVPQQPKKGVIQRKPTQSSMFIPKKPRRGGGAGGAQRPAA